MSPSEEYAQRLKARETQVSRFDKLHIRIGNVRLLLAATIAILGWWSIKRHAFSPWWLLVPSVAFVAIALYHSKVLGARSYALRVVAVYRDGLARIQDRWQGNGQRGEQFDISHHVYSSDLDLFGKGSLFELLSTARTRMGEETLAGWLLTPSSVGQIRERHAAIAELRDQLDFREELAILGEGAGAGVHPRALLKWAEGPNRLDRRWIRWLAPIFALAAISAAILWGVRGIATPFLLVVLVEGSLAYSLRKQLDDILSTAEHAFEDLDLLSAMLAGLEREKFRAPRLQVLMRNLASHDLEASRTIARLRTIVQFIESRRNLFVRILDVPLLYSVQVAFAAETWRRAHGNAVRLWLEVTGEIEALISIAAYSYEHPADPFPEFVDGPALFDGEDLGHPLIPAANCVRNTVSIRGDTRVLLVSGSNMSGKSTLLRSVGINAVMAMAGAPVRALQLQMTPVQVGASIRINDSLHEGSSHFYAEITRLRQLYDLADQKPRLLFLLDELLQGTNSADRRIGAGGIIRAFLERGAIGLISTHDLALTDANGHENGSIHNMHFQDEFEDGKISFDFKLREGVVTRSNGLELMRSIGLKV